VSDLPLCLGQIKHGAPLARGGGVFFLLNIVRRMFGYVVQFWIWRRSVYYSYISWDWMYAWLPVQAYRVYLLQDPSKGPHLS
jgi:hypothetical protein